MCWIQLTAFVITSFKNKKTNKQKKTPKNKNKPKL